MSTVAVFGATGGTGLCLLKRLIGVRPVKCLVRNASKLPEDLRASVEVVEGSATDQEAVAKCVEGASVIVVSLGGPPKGPGVDICSKAQELINKAVALAQTQPLMIVVSSIGVGDHYQHCGLFAKAFAAWVIPEALKDKDLQEAMVREQLRDWIVIRPGGLVDGSAKGRWKVGVDVCGFYPTITRDDVAQFIVEECIQPETSKWLRQSVAIVS